MLIDKNSINNIFELSAEILFGTYITGWRWVEDEDNPPVAGDTYSNVLVLNDETNILAHIQVLFRPDNTWMVMINFEPEISRSIVLMVKWVTLNMNYLLIYTRRLLGQPQ